MASTEQNITPETRLGTLLKAHPQLESVLIDMSPAFAKLKNPILRRTVAKVASLRQVAQIGDVPIAKLINTLRREAGQAADFAEQEGSVQSDGSPSWFDAKKIKKTLDARPILDAGEHPLVQVMNDLNDFAPDEIYELITPFLPAPLIEKVEEKGFRSWSKQEGPELYRNYFIR